MCGARRCGCWAGTEAAIDAAAAGTSEIPPIDATLTGKENRSARFYVNPVEHGTGEEEAVIVNAIADVLPLELHAVRTALVDSSSGRIWRLPRML